MTHRALPHPNMIHFLFSKSPDTQGFESAGNLNSSADFENVLKIAVSHLCCRLVCLFFYFFFFNWLRHIAAISNCPSASGKVSLISPSLYPSTPHPPLTTHPHRHRDMQSESTATCHQIVIALSCVDCTQHMRTILFAEHGGPIIGEGAAEDSARWLISISSSVPPSVCEPETSRIVVWGKKFILLFLESFCFTLSL